MIWAEFETRAPALAALGRERFEKTQVALIATIRRDGSPRISPIEPVFSSGHLLLGSMRSAKTDDLLRDPRCALHSAVSDVNGSEGEFKLYGRALPVAGELRDNDGGRWTRFPPDRSTVFELEIESAVFVGWEIEAAKMRVLRWSLGEGLGEAWREYP